TAFVILRAFFETNGLVDGDIPKRNHIFASRLFLGASQAPLLFWKPHAVTAAVPCFHHFRVAEVYAPCDGSYGEVRGHRNFFVAALLRGGDFVRRIEVLLHLVGHEQLLPNLLFLRQEAFCIRNKDLTWGLAFSLLDAAFCAALFAGRFWHNEHYPRCE